MSTKSIIPADSDVESADQDQGSNRRAGRKKVRTQGTRSLRTALKSTGLLAVVALGLAAPAVLSSGSAGASTPAVSYGSYAQCAPSGKTAVIQVEYPVAVYAVPGTTELYTAFELQFLNSSGQWQNDAAFGGAYATIWTPSGSELYSPWWNGTIYNQDRSVTVKTNEDWRVVGMTYWWTGQSWDSYGVSLGGCY